MSDAPARRDTMPVDQHFTVTPTGLEIRGRPTLDRCERFLRRARTVEVGLYFAIGDLVNYMEDRFGEEAAQVIDPDLGWSAETLRNYRWVARQVPPASRRADLLWSHHQAVAALAPAEQRGWLARAAGDGETGPWPVARLKGALRDGGVVAAVAWWVLVRARDAADQEALVAQLQGMGRECRVVERR